MLIGVTAASAVIAMSTVGFATEETSDDFAAVYNTDKTVSVSADEWAKVATNDNNNQYTLVIVPAGWTGISEGDTDASDDIFYINQDSSSNMQEDVASVAFLNDLADGTYEVRVGSDNNSFDGYKVATFVVGSIDEDTGDYITLTDTTKGTIGEETTFDSSTGAALGYKRVTLLLNTENYTNAGTETPKYYVEVVGNDSNNTTIETATVFYSKENYKYVAIIPVTVNNGDYKFKVSADENSSNSVIFYGDINNSGDITLADLNPVVRTLKGFTTNHAGATIERAVSLDVTGDGAITLADLNPLVRSLKGLSVTKNVLNK